MSHLVPYSDSEDEPTPPSLPAASYTTPIIYVEGTCNPNPQLEHYNDGNVSFSFQHCYTHNITLRATPVNNPQYYYIIPRSNSTCLSDCELVRRFLPKNKPLRHRVETTPAGKDNSPKPKRAKKT